MVIYYELEDHAFYFFEIFLWQIDYQLTSVLNSIYMKFSRLCTWFTLWHVLCMALIEITIYRLNLSYKNFTIFKRKSIIICVNKKVNPMVWEISLGGNMNKNTCIHKRYKKTQTFITRESFMQELCDEYVTK